MKDIYVYMSQSEFCEFSKLAIDSIYAFQVELRRDSRDIIVFYKAANRMFGGVANSKVTKIHITSPDPISVKQIRWKNVINISVYFVDIRALIYVIGNIPQIETCFLSKLLFNDIRGEDVETLLRTNESRLKNLDIWKVNYETPVEDAVKDIMRFLQSLKHLQKLKIEASFGKEAMKQIQQHPANNFGLKNIEIKLAEV